MNRKEEIRASVIRCGKQALRGLFLYVLPPVLCLVLLARPIGNAVRASDAAVFLILLGALVCTGLNLAAYRAVRKKHPPLLVYAHGACCLLAMVAVEYESLLNTYGPTSTLAVIGGCLALAALLLYSFWFASRKGTAAHLTALVIWVIIGFVFVFMVYRVWRDIESKTAGIDTWIILAVLLALIPASFSPLIRSSSLRKKARLRAVGLTEGKIIQIVGETHLDRSDESVTENHARIRYTVGNTEYETKADISKITTRWFGRKAFVGQTVSVHYNPDDPKEAYVNRIDRHFFDK